MDVIIHPYPNHMQSVEGTRALIQYKDVILPV